MRTPILPIFQQTTIISCFVGSLVPIDSKEKLQQMVEKLVQARLLDPLVMRQVEEVEDTDVIRAWRARFYLNSEHYQ